MAVQGKDTLLTIEGLRLAFGGTPENVRAFSTLVVKGASLHISKLSLDTGDVVIDGKINSLQYLGASGGSLRSRLFR